MQTRTNSASWTVQRHLGKYCLTFLRFGRFLCGNSSEIRNTGRDYIQHPCFYQMSDFRKGDVLFNVDLLNFLFPSSSPGNLEHMMQWDHCRWSTAWVLHTDLRVYLFLTTDMLQQFCNVASCGQTCCSCNIA